MGTARSSRSHRRPAWPPGESRLRPPEPLERAPTVRACPAARRRAGRHYKRQPRYIRPLGEQPSRKFLSTRGGRRGLWVCPAVWLLVSISEHLEAEPAVAQDRERVCTDLTMAFVRWRAGASTPSGPHPTASDLAPAAQSEPAFRLRAGLPPRPHGYAPADGRKGAQNLIRTG